MRFADAEQFKINDGFVGLGGAYEDPDNPKQAQVSKVARQVMTRLHIQVNQTIQFYRTQQGGSAPQRVFLAGGASIMRYAIEFFQEKLNLPIEYFNPFRNVTFDPNVNLPELEKVAHSFGEVVGLGLRNLAQCPVELNLIPKSLLKRQQLNQKKPYFVATVFSLVLVVFAYGWFYSKVASVKLEALGRLQTHAGPLNGKKEKLEKEESQISGAKKELDALGAVLEERLFWSEFLTALRRVLVQTELANRQKLGVETGVWFESFTPDLPGEPDPSAGTGGDSDGSVPRPMFMDPKMMARYGLRMPMAPPPAEGAEGAAAPAADASGAAAGDAKTPTGSTNEVKLVNVVCRGINNNKYKASANTEFAFDFQSQLQTNELLRPFLDGTNGTKLSKEIDVVTETDSTFSFGVILKLKRPITL